MAYARYWQSSGGSSIIEPEEAHVLCCKIHSTARFEEIETVLKAAAQKHNSSVLVVSHLGQSRQEETAGGARDAFVFTLCYSKLYAALLAADIRFAGFLPCRVAALARYRRCDAGSDDAF